MTFSFDLISDLHVETWDQFDWTGQPSSPYCIVAGDISRDRKLVIDTLEHLGNCYYGVFYIDGNDEHRYQLEDLGSSYRDLNYQIANIKTNKPNSVVYLQDNVVIINGVAILATNGWWAYDFDPVIDYDEALEWFRGHTGVTYTAASAITSVAYHDAVYLSNSVRKLQTHQDVKSIVIVSHTLPAPWIAEHDLELINTPRYNSLGNRHLQLALDEDTENKIKTWCFGHYHKSVDQNFGGIHYVSNPRGRGDTPWSQLAYYAKRIEVEI
jgi:hypothetical protein